nr:ATP-binding protein [Clostridium culturomicium]
MKNKFKGTMKRKLMLYIFGALVFMLIFTIMLFYAISTYEADYTIKKDLSLYTYILKGYIEDRDLDKTKDIIDKFKERNVRVTVIDEDGNVKYDSFTKAELLENHNDREEVEEARKKGEACVTRYSMTEKSSTMYYALGLPDGDVIRVAKAIDGVNALRSTYFLWYGGAIVIMLFLSLWIANKLSYIFVKPIEDLDFITSRISNGELSRRVKVTSKDELGKLAQSFNSMADKVESSLNEASEKQNRLSAILESMESGVIAIDNNRNIIMINNYAKSFFNISEDVVGSNVENICTDIDFKDMFSMREHELQEYKIKSPTVKYLRGRSADIIVNNHQHIGAVAVLQDITEVKNLENMRTEFVANVSHELKTPLTSIRGFAETLRDVDDDATKNKFLDIIDEEAERLTRLISDILLLSHIEQNQEFKQEEFSTERVIDDVVDIMKHIADKKEIELRVFGDELPIIAGDKDKFKQMLINLIDNGIKYSEAGDKVTVNKISKKKEFIIIVEDTGIGIEESAIPRLFERFYRVDKARSRAKGGTGLGLAIVKHIVIGFNGSVKVESKVGIGTRFIITFPKGKL